MSDFFYKVEGILERKKKLKSLIAVTLFACGGLQASDAAADVYCYANSISTLQTCLNNAAADAANWHEIQLKEGYYNLTSQLTLAKGKVRLVGAGRVSPDGAVALGYSADTERASDRTALNRAKFYVLDGQNQTRIFSAVDESQQDLILYIQGLTFKNGNPTDSEGGGGLRFKGARLGIEHSIFTGNSDSAVWHDAQDQQSIAGSYFYNNTGEYSTSRVCPLSGVASDYWGGALTSHGSDFDIRRSTFENNRGCRGGAIWTAAEMSLTASTVSGNSAARGGGVYFAIGASGSQGMTHSTVYKNHASVSGGGLYLEAHRSSEWEFADNILAGNSASNSTFSDCYLGAGTQPYILGIPVAENVLGRIGVGSSGDCSPWLNPDNNQSTGVLDPQLEPLAYNGSIGLQLKTHLPKASSISLNVASSGEFSGMCIDQRARPDTIFPSSQNKCAAGATQRIRQENGTWGNEESQAASLSKYKMVLTQSQNIRIDLTSDEADALLILKDANNNEIGRNDDYSSSSSNARITRQLSAGVYYIDARIGVYMDPNILKDFFLNVNAEAGLTPSLVLMDNAEIADRSTLGQTGTIPWKRTAHPLLSGTSGTWYYKMVPNSQYDSAIFESDFFDPADTNILFKYFLNGSNSGSLYLDVELNGVWHYNYWVRRSINSSDVSPNWQQASYDFNGLSSQGYNKIRVRLYGWKDRPLNSSHLLSLDNIVISRYSAWNN